MINNDEKLQSVLTLYQKCLPFFEEPLKSPEKIKIFADTHEDFRKLNELYQGVFTSTARKMSNDHAYYWKGNFTESATYKYMPTLMEDYKKALGSQGLFKAFLDEHPLILDFLYDYRADIKSITKTWLNENPDKVNIPYLKKTMDEIKSLDYLNDMDKQVAIGRLTKMNINVSHAEFKNEISQIILPLYFSHLDMEIEGLLPPLLKKYKLEYIDVKHRLEKIKEDFTLDKIKEDFTVGEVSELNFENLQMHLQNRLVKMVNEHISQKQKPMFFQTQTNYWKEYIDNYTGEGFNITKREDIKAFIQNNSGAQALLNTLIQHQKFTNHTYSSALIDAIINACWRNPQSVPKMIENIYKEKVEETPLFVFFDGLQPSQLTKLEQDCDRALMEMQRPTPTII